MISHWKATLFWLIVPYVLVSSAIPQTAGPTSPESVAMSSLAQKEGFKGDLRTTISKNNGVREFDFYENSESADGNVARFVGVREPDGTIIQSPYRTNAEAVLHDDYCQASSVIVGAFLDSVARTTPNFSLIYTVNHFNVVQTLKGATPPDPMTVVTLGGRVVSDGETVIMHAVQSPVFQSQSEYLLFLSPLKGAPSDYHTIDLDETEIVKNGRLYPATERATDRHAWGEDLSFAAQQLVSFVARVPCGE